MLLQELATRLNDYWPFRVNVIFDCIHTNISIFQHYRYIGCITCDASIVVHLKETENASLIRFHILRVCACSLHPIDVKFITDGSEL